MTVNVPFPIVSGKYTGCLPRTDKLGDTFPVFGEVFKNEIIPRSEWRNQPPLKRKRLKKHQYDQKTEGTCTANALSGIISYNWSMIYGLDNWISPAPISIYKFCARGPDTGSTLSCCLKRAQTHGVLLIDNEQNKRILTTLGLNPDHVLAPTGYYQQFPTGWEETAAEIKVDEVFDIANIDEFFTALYRGFSILYGRDGHAIHGVDPIYTNTFVCEYDNSWGNWGQNGFGQDTLAYLQRSTAGYGAYAVRTLRAPKNAEKLGWEA